MSSSDSPYPPNPPPVNARSSPPTARMTIESVPVAARWPLALGIVLILYSGLNLMGGLCSTASPWWNALLKANSSDARPTWMDVGERWKWWTVGLGGLSVILASLLLAVGIGMVGRKAWSMRLSRIWCAGQLVVGLAQGALGFVIQSDMMKAMAADASSRATPFSRGMIVGARFGATFGLIFSLAWALGLPVFLMIWLSRPGVRSEVATWARPVRAGVGDALPEL